VIRRPAIYIFDDAFSALDVHTDALVRSRLAEVAADATVIVVAQRISTIVDADQVIVVEDGRVLGAGTHESLLAQSPTYREFAESQSLDAEVSGPR
jgi:ABC-type multidrug transport system fused ATPase/permease subunit